MNMQIMKIKVIFGFIAILTGLLCIQSPIQAAKCPEKKRCEMKSKHCKRHKCAKENAIVGTWTVVIDFPGQPEYANHVFNVGGTMSGGDSGAIAGPGVLAPSLAFGSPHTGRWEHLGGRHFRWYFFNIAGIIPPDWNPTPTDIMAWLPVVIDGTLSEDGNTMEVTATSQAFAITDPTFTTPLGPPQTVNATYYRITFENLENL